MRTSNWGRKTRDPKDKLEWLNCKCGAKRRRFKKRVIPVTRYYCGQCSPITMEHSLTAFRVAAGIRRDYPIPIAGVL